MKKKRPFKLEIAARIAVVLAVLCASIVTAFVSVPTVFADNILPVSVYGYQDVTNPNGALTYVSESCDPGAEVATLNNGSGNYLTVDFGAVYNIVQVVVVGDPNGFVGVDVSDDASSWTNVTANVGNIGCSAQVLTFTGTARYVRLTSDGSSSMYVMVIEIGLGTATSTPAPSATTPAAATPFPPQPTACVTAMPSATATRQASPTPLIQRTPTPGGPTATPGPTATGTPLPSFDSGIATFAQSLQPWTASEQFSGGGIYLTEWQSTAGPDSFPGVAFMRDINNLTFDPSDVLTTTEPMSGSLTYIRQSGMFFPLRVTGQVKWSNQLLSGEHASLRVWYFDPDYLGAGQGVWVTAHGWKQEYSAIWGRFSFLLAQHSGSGRVTAIAISEDFTGEARDGEGALLDDLRIYSGPQAVAGSYPTCQGSGAGGPAPIATKTCKIRQIMIDVYSSCIPPDSGIDVVAWLAYVGCRILRYFTFLSENQQQITDLIARQNADEPFGTFIEMSNITGVIGQLLKDISSIYANNTVSYRAINWDTLWNFRQLDDVATLLHVPNDPGVVERYRARCPTLSQDSMNSRLFADYGCLVIVFTRDQIPLFGAWQWVIDISSIIGLVIYARSILSKSPK